MIAVSGTNKTICAYGRWSPATGSTYVTMDNVSTCSAVDRAGDRMEHPARRHRAGSPRRVRQLSRKSYDCALSVSSRSTASTYSSTSWRITSRPGAPRSSGRRPDRPACPTSSRRCARPMRLSASDTSMNCIGIGQEAGAVVALPGVGPRRAQLTRGLAAQRARAHRLRRRRLEHLLDHHRRHVALGAREPDRPGPHALRAHRERRRDLRALPDAARGEHRRVGRSPRSPRATAPSS